MRAGWLLFLLLGPGVSIANDQLSDPVSDASILEHRLQGLLARVQSKPVDLIPFVSDGCSGGLSAGWKLITDALPGLENQIGELPPWQHCCVNHDREYWRGPGMNGSRLRQLADDELRSCVLATRESPQLLVTSFTEGAGEALRNPEPVNNRVDWASELDRLYPLAAELMYRVVRVGGMPCSGLPWRWGYGSPPCGVGLWLPMP